MTTEWCTHFHLRNVCAKWTRVLMSANPSILFPYWFHCWLKIAKLHLKTQWQLQSLCQYICSFCTCQHNESCYIVLSYVGMHLRLHPGSLFRFMPPQISLAPHFLLTPRKDSFYIWHLLSFSWWNSVVLISRVKWSFPYVLPQSWRHLPRAKTLAYNSKLNLS